ncbi:L-glutamate gamma-semialdehyde dehydrogenase [Aminiphilus circumscriptus]|jgi:1-pyrroline-5-carboxylate dehydrogenase|uniref:L-glutamate gamma-semialdehyde dehydrogenase n=1 Tax=Aminiphilus circumscriptus TaxID=290732 RepID=UPI00047860B8|nr:L-glutamate gamma-semialdehyde dehydrogenase [Aminiphilus circumscriptus]
MWKMDRPKNDADALVTYGPGSPERERLLAELERVRKTPRELPCLIGGEKVYTGKTIPLRVPHDATRFLGNAHLAGPRELEAAVENALEAWRDWSTTPWYQRAAVFQRAADMLATVRRTEHIAAIMTNLSKTPFEAEIDLAELVDFWRFNVFYLHEIYQEQPLQGRMEINRFDWRPLEGFIVAVTPFNFYSIAGNLPTAPAMCGNVVLWKPAKSVLYANYLIMELLLEAGLPPGVVNYVPFSSADGATVLRHPFLSGLHFTGSYATFLTLWQTIGSSVESYRSFPRVVGETGGKDFIFAHASADPIALGANLLRGGFELQGQKCSAASRAYIPESLWGSVEEYLRREVPLISMGPVEDLGNAMGAVIDEEAFRKIKGYLDYARNHPEEYTLLLGGGCDNRKGWFVEPTVIRTSNPRGKLMTEEIFGPVITVYVYPDDAYEETLRLCDVTTEYALTGAVFAGDRAAIATAECLLRHAAGNFYINDKPTGAVVGRQPFGGSRHSGTNDKAGFWNNLTRWLSPRNIKETTVPATNWRRPFLG